MKIWQKNRVSSPPPSLDHLKRILVIRLGALGDMVLCNAAFSAIHNRWPLAEKALLTGPAFVHFGWQMPYFDKVMADPRPQWHQWKEAAALYQQIRDFSPDLVIDLQGKPRQNFLYRLLKLSHPHLLWCGAAPGCSHPRLWPPEADWHFLDMVAAQLSTLGVEAEPWPRLGWMRADIARLNVPEKYVVLIVGSAPERPEKRWPIAHYAQLARHMVAHGFSVVAVGSGAEATLIQHLCELEPAVINICGQTNLAELATVLRGAHSVVGNDTGPSHMAAAVGTPTLTLFHGDVNPGWSAPRGKNCRYLIDSKIDNLRLENVYEAWLISAQK